jgi:hypothetical protein
MKVTKRYSHGLDVQYAFTYQKELANGANSDTSYLTPNPPLINDVFNTNQNKQISGFSRPLVSVISLNYRTPGFSAANKGLHVVSYVVKDWVIGGVLRYQSGALIRVPASNNNFLPQLQRGPANNPAVWGGGNTFQNRVAGQPLFLKDPNCHCIDPTNTLVLNPNAWTDVGPGQFGATAPYIDGYRWQRQPSESISLGRIFPLAKEGKINLNVRMEFQNIFNRTFLSTPSATNPQGLTLKTNPFPNGQLGALSGGYGYISTTNGGLAALPRTAQLVARIQF